MIFALFTLALHVVSDASDVRHMNVQPDYHIHGQIILGVGRFAIPCFRRFLPQNHLRGQPAFMNTPFTDLDIIRIAPA